MDTSSMLFLNDILNPKLPPQMEERIDSYVVHEEENGVSLFR